MSNYIYGKIKRKKTPFRVLATDTDVYETNHVAVSAIEYSPNTLTEEDELYKLSNFSDLNFGTNLLSIETDSVNFDQINKADLRNLSYICTIQNNLYFFQIINSSYYINKKWFKIDEPILETNKPIITINPVPDVVYNKTSDILYFKKLSVANRIFKGMDQLYREATDQETQDFLNSDFLAVEPLFTKEKVAIPNRKRIALVKETLNNFSDEEKRAIYDYINQYGRVIYSDGRFRINNDEDLKFVLWGIEQRFYTTPITGEKRVANSIMAI